jgi:hypothetical protein
VPVAVNCWVLPSEIEEFSGDNATEDSAAALTVSVVEPVTDPSVAVMVLCPALALVVRPFVPAALLMVATVGELEDHATVVVMLCVLPSV